MSLPRSGHPRKATLGPGPSSAAACLPARFPVCLLTLPGGRAGWERIPPCPLPPDSRQENPECVFLSIRNGMDLVSVLGLCLTGPCLFPSLSMI